MYSYSLEARRVGRLVCVHSTTYTYWSDCGKQKSVQGRVGASKHKTTSTSPLRPVLFHLGQEEGRRIGYSSSRRRVYLVCQMLSAGWLYNVLHIPVMARYEYNNNNTVCSFVRSFPLHIILVRVPETFKVHLQYFSNSPSTRTHQQTKDEYDQVISHLLQGGCFSSLILSWVKQRHLPPCPGISDAEKLGYT